MRVLWLQLHESPKNESRCSSRTGSLCSPPAANAPRPCFAFATSATRHPTSLQKPPFFPPTLSTSPYFFPPPCTDSVLGRRIDKSQQCSDWAARPLSEAQRAYAATDAYTLVLLFQQLLQLRRQRQEQLGLPLISPTWMATLAGAGQ